MKIGLFYEDIKTGELFMLNNFTYFYYEWINVKGENITEDKTEAWKHMNNYYCTNKKKIKEFLDNLKYNVRGLCHTCNKTYVSKFKKYVRETPCGDELCSVCGDKMTY